jgi:hypothetical protein
MPKEQRSLAGNVERTSVRYESITIVNAADRSPLYKRYTLNKDISVKNA